MGPGIRPAAVDSTCEAAGSIGMEEQLTELAGPLRSAETDVVFTGPGVSAPSGIPDFRSEDGIWAEHDPGAFHIHEFRTDPGGFWEALLEARAFEPIAVAGFSLQILTVQRRPSRANFRRYRRKPRRPWRTEGTLQPRIGTPLRPGPKSSATT